MQFTNDNKLTDLHNWLDRIFFGLSGYSVYLYVGNFIKYDIVKLVLAAITAIVVALCGEFSKKVLYPYLDRKYRTWKKSWKK